MENLNKPTAMTHAKLEFENNLLNLIAQLGALVY